MGIYTTKVLLAVLCFVVGIGSHNQLFGCGLNTRPTAYSSGHRPPFVHPYRYNPFSMYYPPYYYPNTYYRRPADMPLSPYYPPRQLYTKRGTVNADSSINQPGIRYFGSTTTTVTAKPVQTIVSRIVSTNGNSVKTYVVAEKSNDNKNGK